MASAISSMGTAHNQVYNSIVAPQQAFHDLSIECEPFNTRVKFASSDRKRKRGSAYSKLQPSIIQDVEHSLDEKEVEKKFSNHFMALTDILENEKLRKEIHCVESEISLYDEYKKQQKIKAATSKARRKGVSKSWTYNT